MPPLSPSRDWSTGSLLCPAVHSRLDEKFDEHNGNAWRDHTLDVGGESPFRNKPVGTTTGLNDELPQVIGLTVKSISNDAYISLDILATAECLLTTERLPSVPDNRLDGQATYLRQSSFKPSIVPTGSFLNGDSPPAPEDVVSPSVTVVLVVLLVKPGVDCWTKKAPGRPVSGRTERRHSGNEVI